MIVVLTGPCFYSKTGAVFLFHCLSARTFVEIDMRQEIGKTLQIWLYYGKMLNRIWRCKLFVTRKKR